jgi:hypothetical protein
METEKQTQREIMLLYSEENPTIAEISVMIPSKAPHDE